MTSDQQTSRPLTLAATLRGDDLLATEQLFNRRRVLVRVEYGLADSIVAHEAALLAVNEILRFCPNVTLAMPPGCANLAEAAVGLARELRGSDANVDISALRELAQQAFDAVLTIGGRRRDHADSICVDASGWCARVTATAAPTGSQPPRTEPANIFSWLAAASLGVGQVFLTLVGRRPVNEDVELSLWDLTAGRIGDLDLGPSIGTALELSALLVGCGGVANGFAYAAARSPLRGSIEAVDKQSVRKENLGPYVGMTRRHVGVPKAEAIRELLAPAIAVRARAERFHFFKARIGYGQTIVPALVLAGLDNSPARHDVQRLWAPVTIDMAAAELTAQLIVKHIDDDGVCLIGAFALDEHAPGELELLAAELGLPVERVANFESEITPADVAAAPPRRRQALREASGRGQRICGRATQLDLHEEGQSDTFAPAVPFVTAFSGITAAAQTTRQLLGEANGSFHFQFSFLTYHAQKIQMRCSPNCECADHRH